MSKPTIALRPFQLLFFILFCLNSYYSSAQTLVTNSISGTFLDEKGIPLPAITVVVQKSADASVYKSGLSNNQGQFNIEGLKEGSYNVKVSLLGYETFSKNNLHINQSNSAVNIGVIKLVPSMKMLSAVSVVGQKPLIERRADKTVINLNNPISAPSMMDLFNQLPGVQVNPDDQINLNGRNVRIYIDGKITPLSSEALASLLKGMSPSSIQKVELIAHPSSKYDAAGSGGIINIVRKKNNKDGISGNAYGGFGQGEYAKYNGGLNLNYKGKSFNLFFNGDNSFNKYFVNSELRNDFLNGQTLIGRSNSDINSVRKNRTYTPNLGLDLYLSPKTTLSFSAYEGITIFNKDAQSYITGTSSGVRLSPTNFDNLVKTNSNNFSTSAHLVSQLDTGGKEITADLDFYSYSNNSDQNNTNTLFNPAGQFLSSSKSFFDQDRRFNVYSAKTDYTHPFRNGGNLEIGWKSSYVRSNNTNRFFNLSGSAFLQDETQNDFFRYSEYINALYANYSKTYKKFSYQLGIRGESTWGKGEQLQTGQVFNRNYLQIFPSAYLDYKFKAGHGLNLSVDKKTDRPTYENLNPLVRIINSTNYQQGNPNLRPVISYNSSLTYSYKNALFATLNYSINLRDFIYLTSAFDSAGVTTTKPDNNKHSQYYSFILAYNKQVKSWWFTSTNITLSQQSFTTNNASASELNSSGILAFNLDTYNSVSLTKKFSIISLLRYRGKSIDRNITNEPYFTLTTGIRQALFGTRGSLSLNVTDVFHTYKSQYVQKSASVIQYWTNYYETTAARLTFTYNFGGKVNKTKSSNAADEEKKRTNLKEN